MTATPGLPMRETPVFTDIARASFAVAFELVPDAPRAAFRLPEIYRTVMRGESHKAAQRLFDASRSFLDDITTGLPGTNGRPLLFAASAEPGDAATRRTTMLRPESWAYDFENTEVDLIVSPKRREAEVRLQDLFCAFESGRLFYILVIAHDPAKTSRWDEYDVIRLQRLAIEKTLANRRGHIAFRYADRTLSLTGLANRRLAAIAELGADTPNAVNHLLCPFGLLPKNTRTLRVRSEAIRNAMVFVEDEQVFAAARHANEHYARRAEGEIVVHPQEMLDAEAVWQKANSRRPRGGRLPHVAASFVPKPTDVPAPRPLLAFAGMAQAVPDFPRQDDSEIHDSTRPAHAAIENLFYVHPAFQLEVGINWRSFRDTQGELGACPYAILSWAIALHDELIVSDMEERIETMLFGPLAPDAPDKDRGRAVPLGALADQLDRVSSLFPRRNRILDESLRARLDIFRWCSIYQSGNVFRYPMERQLLEAIREARGTRQRFDDAHAMVERHEALMEDLRDLAANYTASRTGWLVTALTFMSVLAIPKGLADIVETYGKSGYYFAATAAILGVLALLFWIRNLRSER